MAWRHHDSSVADPFPKSSEYDASDVAKLQEVIISLRKPPPSLLYVTGLSNVWKLAGYIFSLKDSKGKVVTMAEFLRFPNFQGSKVAVGSLLPPGTTRVLDDKEKKTRKAKEKVAAHVVDADIQPEKVVTKIGDGKEDARKRRRVRLEALVQQESEHVSSPTPLNHAKPLETLACKPSPTPLIVRGLTDSSRMDNSCQCRDMMSNLFTYANHEFFNEGVGNGSAVKRSWKLLCQSARQQANTLLCFETLMEEHVDLVYVTPPKSDRQRNSSIGVRLHSTAIKI
ncbi:hypothetical protein Tco_0663081 [Tanacetum coccineum]